VQGTQGTQGTQGLDGVQGTVGAQGIQGTQGVQGTGGIQGTQGTVGSFGGATFDYTFSTNTTNADPGTGVIRFNASPTSATAMYIDASNDDSTDISSFLQTIDDSTSTIKGHFRVSKKLDTSVFKLYTISSLTDNTGWFTVNGSYVSGNGTLSDLDDVLITFARTGDVGAQGTQGTDGAQGIQGTQGVQGVQGLEGFVGSNGAQGTQGTLGSQGTVGAQGTQGTLGSQGTTGAQGTQGQVSADPTTTVLLYGGM
jgi:hypothetical protein